MEVAPGAAMGLAGANGAGKTTFIKCALDLCAADAGRVEIFGVDSRQASARARLAYLPNASCRPITCLAASFSP
jgi:ABC-2 type transport system ATP-binding protein